MDVLNAILKSAPEIALFAALALGHALGRLRLGSFSLGGVAGSLIVYPVRGALPGPAQWILSEFGLSAFAVWGPAIVALT